MPPKFSRELTRPTSYEAEPPKDQPRTFPCEPSCPAGHDIQRTIHLLQNSRFEEALENVRAKHPFPGVCGRACFHPCEDPCNRKFYDQGISVRALERAAFDLADRQKVRAPKGRAKTGKRVAIIGSGPAGMTCAYFSALFGHEVTLFEALPVLGGMPKMGIPDHRLPKDVLDEEVAEILKLGVEARTGTRIGEDFPFREIMAEAIGQGRLAAIAMDSYLTGKPRSGIQSIYLDPDGHLRTEDFGPDGGTGKSSRWSDTTRS